MLIIDGDLTIDSTGHVDVPLTINGVLWVTGTIESFRNDEQVTVNTDFSHMGSDMFDDISDPPLYYVVFD